MKPRPILLYFFAILFCTATYAQADPIKTQADSLDFIGKKWLDYANMGKWDSALFYAKKYESLVVKIYGEKSHGHAIVLSEVLGKIANAMNDNLSACHYFKSSINIYNVTLDTACKEYVYALYALGMIDAAINAQEDAEFYLTKAVNHLHGSKQLKTDPIQLENYCQSILGLAAIFAGKGEYARAANMDFSIQGILDTLTKTPYTNYILASSYNNLAIIYSQTGDMRKALNCLRKATEVGLGAKELNYNQDIEMLLNLAELFSLNRELDSAQAVCDKVEIQLKTKYNFSQFLRLLKEKAMICQMQEKFEEAIQDYEKYTNLTYNLQIRPDAYDETLLNLGLLYIKTAHYDLARNIFTKEENKLLQSGMKYSYAMQQLLALISVNFLAQNKIKEAYDSTLSLCHLTLTSISKNFYGMSEAEKMKYKNGLNKYFNLLYTCLDNMSPLSRAMLADAFNLEIQRNSLVLQGEVNLFGSLRTSKDTLVTALYSNWLNNKQILSKQYSVPLNHRIFNTDSLENICETLEKRVSYMIGSNAAYTNYSPSIGFSTDDAKSANIQFIRYNYEKGRSTDSVLYAALIKTNGDSSISFVNLCSEKVLTALMKNKKGEWIDENQLTQKIYNPQGKSAVRLYQLIWEPLIPYLKGIKKINYVPTGVLNNIAFHAVFDGKEYLVRQYSFRRFFNLPADNMPSRKYENPSSISIWGNMDYDRATYLLTQSLVPTPIPNTAFSNEKRSVGATRINKSISSESLKPFDSKEVAELRKIFSGHNILINSYQKAYSTEEKFKEKAASTKGVLHISTHGFYASLDENKSRSHLPSNFIPGTINPLFRCGLAFSGANYYWSKGVPRQNHEDGILTGYEISQLDLHDVQLLTLSACESGLGEITGDEGNIGLQRAFKLAGVQNMLVSLWQVPAKQTAELLSIFYRNWLNGNSLNIALQKAEKEMQGKKYPPYFWAGFVLIE